MIKPVIELTISVAKPIAKSAAEGLILGGSIAAFIGGLGLGFVAVGSGLRFCKMKAESYFVKKAMTIQHPPLTPQPAK